MSSWHGRLVRKMGLKPTASGYLRLQKALNDVRSPLARKTYAQFGEDVVMRGLLDTSVGAYLDVGAGRARRGSNSYLFYKQGWSGVAVDPLATNRREFERYRSRDTFVQGLCGGSSTKVDFYEFAPYEYSTMCADVALQRTKEGHFLRGVYEISQLRIMDLEIQINPVDNFFMSVDVEGAEMDVIEGISWQRFLPRVICIEMWNSTRESTTLLPDTLAARGYRLVALLGPSLIFVHKDFWRHELQCIA